MVIFFLNIETIFVNLGHVFPCSKLPNALPYIGAYLDQIYALEMNSKTYNPDGLVNFAKMTKLAQMIQNVLQYQKSRFGFEPRLDVSCSPVVTCAHLS